MNRDRIILKTLKISLLILTLGLVESAGFSADCGETLKEGDIVFQEHATSQREAIQLSSHSKYTHMGIILPNPYDGKLYIYEAVGPVKFTPIQDWIAQGVGSHFVAKRLKKADTLLTPAVLKRMEEVAQGFYGKPYDWLFLWSDDKMYCSELVWKIYNRSTGLEIGHLKKLKEFDFSSSAVQALLKERYGDKVPWNEPIISPGQMFESDLLTTVESQ